MDGAASVFAAVSLAIQLAENVKKLSDFWKSVQNAPKDVHDIVADLELLSPILNEIESEAERNQSHLPLENALRGCISISEELTAILESFQTGLASDKRARRKWTAIKCARKLDKLSRFQDRLERLKTNLILVLQFKYGYSSRIRDEQLIMVVRSHFNQASTKTRPERAISVTVPAATNRLSLESPVCDDSSIVRRSSCSAQQPKLLEACDILSTMSKGAVITTDLCQTASPPGVPLLTGSKLWKKQLLYVDRRHLNSIFGSASITTTTKLIELAAYDPDNGFEEAEQKLEEHISVLVRPAEWLRALGLEFALRMNWWNSPIEGLSFTLSCLRLVPDDAPIFQLCSNGDLIAVRELLASGKASVRDMNSKGSTPLHCAASCHRPELCKLLIAAGADKTAHADEGPNPYDKTPLMYAIDKMFKTKSVFNDKIDTVRLFLDTVDFSDTSCDGWSTVRSVAIGLLFNLGDHEDNIAFFVWMLKYCLHDMRANLDMDNFCDIIFYSLCHNDALSNVLKVLPPGDQSFIGDCGSVLLAVIATDLGTTNDLLMAGADPHHVGRCLWPSQCVESPTSMAMYNSKTFASWLKTLDEIGLDLKSFLDKEMKTSLLADKGWVRQTLYALFTWKFAHTAAFDFKRFVICGDCGKSILELNNGIVIDPLWVHSLHEIKLGKNPEETAWALYVPFDEHMCDDEDPSGFDVALNTASSSASLSEANDQIKHASASSNINSGIADDLSNNPKPDSNLPPCPYTPYETICMKCWLYFCENDSDGSTEDGFSPFSVHF